MRSIYLKTKEKFIKIKEILKCIILLGNNFSKKRFILLNEPDHGNLGDHAIAIAEIRFLKDFFPEIPIVEISGDFLRRNFFFIKLFVKNKDILMITGGGFMGSLWMREENLIRKIISSFPDNQIFFFPQTIFFTDDNEGIKELKKSKTIYQTHQNIHMCLRDSNSYNLIKRYFPKLKNVHYFPDMVTYLNESNKEDSKRNGVLLCLRKDLEKSVDNQKLKKVLQFILEKGCLIRESGTVEPFNISILDRKKYVEKKLSEFRENRLVITDRLHGMIFSTITGTPCIAFDNVSKKVSGVYEWLKNIEYIRIVNTYDEFLKAFDDITENKIGKGYLYQNPNIDKFNEMAELIKCIIKD